MPFRAYTPDEKAEALEVIAQHGDIQDARAVLVERWGYGPSASTLSLWQVEMARNGQSKGITPPEREQGQNGALKPFEGGTATPLARLLEVVSQIAEDPAYVVIIVGKHKNWQHSGNIEETGG